MCVCLHMCLVSQLYFDLIATYEYSKSPKARLNFLSMHLIPLLGITV
jgi:hypothetical protein